ncbi:MAG TPA: hypothetical protein VMR33_12140 [Candidatus Baltobacteraceae bacterium]|nr:hypothetical protein [Candidatus Baltobacteraceae bacterium]
MKSWDPPDNHHLSAAIGWLELGNWKEANEDLEKITPAMRLHPDFLVVRYEVYAKAGKWDTAAEFARALIQLRPEEAQFWISHAYATRRMPGGGIPQAKEVLVEARRLFPKELLIAYNLACYECQLGNLMPAREWLETAFDLGNAKQVKVMALNDRDLEPLWAELAKL